MGREERLALVDRSENRNLPVKTQAKLLGLNRSSLYCRPVEPSEEELALKRRIDEIYADHPYYGGPADRSPAARRGISCGPEAGRAVYAGDGHRGHLAMAAV